MLPSYIPWFDVLLVVLALVASQVGQADHLYTFMAGP